VNTYWSIFKSSQICRVIKDKLSDNVLHL